MSKKEHSELVEACARLDEAISAHGKSSRELGRLSFDSRKDVGKAEEIVTRLAALQEELGNAMQGFVTVLGQAREVQQGDAEKVQARAMELLERKRELAALDERLHLVVGAVKAVRDLLEKIKESGGTGGAGEATGKLSEIAELAQGVADDARAAGFTDVADEAHAVRQQLDHITRRAQKLPQA